MRLVDLEPTWSFDRAGRQGMGVSFLCPCCRKTTIFAPFKNPIDGGAPGWPDRKCHWQRTGETFETLTLAPSVDCSSFGHWHGFITNGEVR